MELTREQLIEMVRSLMELEVGSEEDEDRVVEALQRNVPHPRMLNLIYHPELEGLTDEASAEEIVDAALTYTPFAL
ncbi:bacteriocin immunity protein [Streptomyces tendae]|uniref:bacteriocin immunity protein n=1 Tax=Streptomyces tendae TaxID=1932 RepID=UPI00344065DD